MIITTINGGIKEQQLLHGIIGFPNIWIQTLVNILEYSQKLSEDIGVFSKYQANVRVVVFNATFNNI
jgi:hypothetical protein